MDFSSFKINNRKRSTMNILKGMGLIKEDLIKGGMSDHMTFRAIAEKHKVSLLHILNQFEIGIGIEKEHTDDINIASEIAKDHLAEDPDYYTKLQDMEAKKL